MILNIFVHLISYINLAFNRCSHIESIILSSWICREVMPLNFPWFPNSPRFPLFLRSRVVISSSTRLLNENNHNRFSKICTYSYTCCRVSNVVTSLVMATLVLNFIEGLFLIGVAAIAAKTRWNLGTHLLVVSAPVHSFYSQQLKLLKV